MKIKYSFIWTKKWLQRLQIIFLPQLTGFVTKYGTHLEPKIPTNERGDSVFPPLGGSWPFLKHKIYSKMKDRFPDYTYVFEPTFSGIYFTGWFYFSDIFSVFAGLTGFISGFLNFFYYFIFPLYFTVTCIRTWVDSYFYRLFIGSFSTNGYVSQREAPDNILISWPIRSLQKYESHMQVTVKYNGKIKW